MTIPVILNVLRKVLRMNHFLQSRCQFIFIIHNDARLAIIYELRKAWQIGNDYRLTIVVRHSENTALRCLYIRQDNNTAVAKQPWKLRIFDKPINQN